MTRLIISLCLLAAPHFLFSNAGKYDFEWSEGKVTLTDGKTVEGNVFYDYQNGVVAFQQKGLIKAYTAKSIASFYYFDKKLNTHRYYKSYSFQNEYHYSSTLFFELIIDGDIALVRREKRNVNFNLIRSKDPSSYYSKFNSYFDYWVVLGGQFVDGDTFKRHAFPILKENFDIEEKEHINTRDLQLNLMGDLIVIVEYFSFLAEEERGYAHLMRASASARR